ncbi:MAG: Regulatory protein (modular protein) [Acidimicrobiia bacterium]|nr:Regulatory protein (modular protein) [Acidimicrobiia bacterium]
MRMSVELRRGLWPLVGRAEERRLVADAIEDGRGAIVGGRPGMGRSRFANETAAMLREAGRSVVQLWGIESLADRPLAALSLSLEAGGTATVEDQPRTVWRRLVAMAEEGPLGIIVDDAHHLDTMSAEILLLLARQRHAVVIATVRSHHGLPSPIVGLRKDLGALRLDLLPLGRRETATLARHALGAEVDAELLQELWRLVRGNPLYLREVLSQRTTLDCLEASGGVVRLRRPLMVSAGLDDVVQMRLAGLGAGARSVLEMLSVGPLTLDQLSRLADPADLAALEEEGLVVVPDDPTRMVRIGLPLHAEVLRAAMARSTRAAIAELINRDPVPLPVPASSWEALLTDARRLLHSQPHRAERLARQAYQSDPGLATATALADALASSGRLLEADGLLASEGLPDSAAARRSLQSARGGDADHPMLMALRGGDPMAALSLVGEEVEVPRWSVPVRQRWSIEARLWAHGPDAVAEEAISWFHASLGHSLLERGQAALAWGTVAYWQGQHEVASARLSEAARLLAGNCAEGHGQATVMRQWLAAAHRGEGGSFDSDFEAISDPWWAAVGAGLWISPTGSSDALGAALVAHAHPLAVSALAGPIGASVPTALMGGRLGEALHLVARATGSGQRHRARDALRVLPPSLHWLVHRAASVVAASPASSGGGAEARPAAPTRPLPFPRALLTGRELEVAGLAASGLTDVEIARQLVVSPRTVQTHLARVYRKLGVSGRRTLKAALSGSIGASLLP